MNVLKVLVNSSIKNKITGAIITVVSIIAIFIILYFPSRQKQEVLRGLRAKAESLAVMLAYNVSPGLNFEDHRSVEEAIEGAKHNEDLSYIAIYDLQDRIFASYNQEEGKEFLQKKKITKTESYVHQKVLSVYTPILSQTGKIGYLTMGLSLSNLKKEVAYNQRITFLVSLLIIFFGVVIASYLSNLLTQPILKLTDAARKLSEGERKIKVEIQTEDEIGILGQTFNQMIIDLNSSKEQLIQQEKMASVGQLAAGVAHELNNPLGGILGYSQFALEKITKKSLEDLTPDDIATYSQYLKDIEFQSQRCKTIVQNLLKFARASTKVAFEPVNLSSVLRDTLVFVRHQMEMSGVELVTDLKGSLPEVIGNANQLQQVFTNIIINAIQAMPDGGKLFVSIKEMPETQLISRSIEITFKDTGCGISEEHLSNIFEPFFTTKKVGQGTGLGLSVSYGIIKDHKGEIFVESRVGKGTKFTIWLPIFLKDKPLPAEKKEEVLKSV